MPFHCSRDETEDRRVMNYNLCNPSQFIIAIIPWPMIQWHRFGPLLLWFALVCTIAYGSHDIEQHAAISLL